MRKCKTLRLDRAIRSKPYLSPECDSFTKASYRSCTHKMMTSNAACPFLVQFLWAGSRYKIWQKKACRPGPTREIRLWASAPVWQTAHLPQPEDSQTMCALDECDGLCNSLFKGAAIPIRERIQYCNGTVCRVTSFETWATPIRYTCENTSL